MPKTFSCFPRRREKVVGTPVGIPGFPEICGAHLKIIADSAVHGPSDNPYGLLGLIPAGLSSLHIRGLSELDLADVGIQTHNLVTGRHLLLPGYSG